MLTDGGVLLDFWTSRTGRPVRVLWQAHVFSSPWCRPYGVCWVRPFFEHSVSRSSCASKKKCLGTRAAQVPSGARKAVTCKIHLRRRSILFYETRAQRPASNRTEESKHSWEVHANAIRCFMSPLGGRLLSGKPIASRTRHEKVCAQRCWLVVMARRRSSAP